VKSFTERRFGVETDTQSGNAADESEEENSMETQALSADDLAAVRALALRAYPETVPELVAGDNVATLLQSLQPAAAAYRRIADGISASAATPSVPVVPAGSAPPVTLDPDRLPSVEKIRRALASRR
jgi:hypothetical protein